MIPKNPCKPTCEERKFGCHSTCEKYIKFRQAKDKVNHDKWVYKQECSVVNEVRIKHIKNK